jgi:hypothetical protein
MTCVVQPASAYPGGHRQMSSTPPAPCAGLQYPPL